ncbi:uncharacterized protein BXIN_1926 [Babesia sp. Xinjiang]|uniref:uncharacterized protein n=1 Tax=Babesia sp. Xinjiang TaxID=462227 RepID=UPI000A249805|nr:uncharacterized protein BXIN_1926 [Babesia sp. Xinjiang]ORM40609.1 hypothetical protein BXIN_1926 [Babesia sp. Xinjiang]
MATVFSQVQLLLHLLGLHDRLEALFEGVLIPPNQVSQSLDTIDSKSCNKLLLKMLPMLRHGRLEASLEPICSKFTKFVAESIATSLTLTIDRGFDGAFMAVEKEYIGYDPERVINQLWDAILVCHSSSLSCEMGEDSRPSCYCKSIISGLLVNQLSRMITLGAWTKVWHCDTAYSVMTKRLIGLYGRWAFGRTTASGIANVTEGRIIDPLLARSIIDGREPDTAIGRINECIALSDRVSFVSPIPIKKEDSSGYCLHGLSTSDSYLMSSFVRFYTEVHDITNLELRDCIDVLAGAILLIEDSHLHGDVIIDEGYSRPLVATELSMTFRGRAIVNRVLRKHHGYIWVPESLPCEDPSCDPYLGPNASSNAHMCSYIIRLHDALCDAVATGSTNITFFADILMSDRSFTLDDHRVEFLIGKRFAFSILNHLCDVLQRAETCIGNLPIQVSSDLPKVSAIPYAMVAVASLMGARIMLHSADVHLGLVTVKVLLTSRPVIGPNEGSLFVTHDELLNLFLRLFYAEISMDVCMALEYHSVHLGRYRMLLVHYLRRVLVLPTRQPNTIDFVCSGPVGFDNFTVRLMRLIFFRVHCVLLDFPKLESFLRTRVEYYQRHDPGEDDLFTEMSHGYIDLTVDDDDNAKSVNRDVHGVSSIDHRIFGFLEYSARHRIHRDMFVEVKREYCESSAVSHYPGYNNNAECGERPLTSSLVHCDRIPTYGGAVSLNGSIQHIRGLSDYDVLFFESAFELCGHLRFSIDRHQLFQHNKVDRMLYQLLMHICHVDKSVSTQRNYEVNVVCNIRCAYDTDEYGELSDQSSASLGMDTVDGPCLYASDDNCDIANQSSHVNLDLLFVGRSKFTKRSYYIISRLAIESLVRWLSPKSASSAVCRWAASVPIDTTSRVKSHKPETARSIVAMLTIGLLCHASIPLGAEFLLSDVDSLVSAANVCFVNLKVSFDTVSLVEEAIDVDASPCETSGDPDYTAVRVKAEPSDDRSSVPLSSDRKTNCDRLSITDSLHGMNSGTDLLRDSRSVSVIKSEHLESSFVRPRSYVPGELQLWKDQRLREYRIRRHRLARLRNDLRKNLLKEGVHLLQTCALFVHILGHLVLQHMASFRDNFTELPMDKSSPDSAVGNDSSPAQCALDVPVTSVTSAVVSEEGFVTPDEGIDADPIEDVDNKAVVCGKLSIPPDPKVRSRLYRLMQFVVLSCNTLDSLFSACSAVSRCCVAGDFDVSVWDNDHFFSESEDELELLLHEISFLRDKVVSHVAPLQLLYRGAGDSLFDDEYTSVSGSSSGSDASGDDADDDLAGFIDFDTDRHLGMVMSRHVSKRNRTSSRLRGVVLRSEWNCLIKSYLS